MAEWNPWQEMHRLRHDVDRAFEQVGGRNGGRHGRTFPTAFLPGHAARAYPLVNVSEDAHALYVTALAPGLEPTAIQLTVQDNRLTIAGEKQRVAAEIQPEAFHRSERAAGTFVRTVTFPIDVEHETVQAEYTNGLLVVTVPKAEHAKPKQIAVSVAGEDPRSLDTMSEEDTIVA